MTEQQNRKYQEYVPDYEIIFAGYKKNRDYCLVIPVINEGERIHSLLNRMNELQIHSYADIIIVDGGTTDGSLDLDYLKSCNVHALLLKTSPGKLSAQLLCAYDYARKFKYQGIVTIDGNNKDSPEPIPDFINKLTEGYDFVQASRFITGGTAVNTPLSRDLAIRLIHAPVLSIASGFHWTDTTQGFRAYSAKFLFDEHVAIFREVFSCYELLAYLSYIGPRLGFKCIEMPSKRIYPQGQVPTKISSIRGNMELLKVLFKAAFGKYNQEDK